MLTEQSKIYLLMGQRASSSPTCRHFGLRPLSQAGMSNQDCYQQEELEYLPALTLLTAKSRAVRVGAQCEDTM